MQPASAAWRFLERPDDTRPTDTRPDNTKTGDTREGFDV
jgi:hypothetical protein